MPENKQPTIKDVSRLANVSPVTVSRSLRSPHLVSEDTRVKVDNAVKMLGYVPNIAASNLRARHSNTIFVLIPSISNHVFQDVLSGVSKAIADSRFTIQIGNTHYDALVEENLVQKFTNSKPAGIIISGLNQSSRTKAILSEADYPVIQIMDLAENYIDWNVGFSHEAAGFTATHHLIEQGYQDIMMVSARMDKRTQKRIKGYKRAIHTHAKQKSPITYETPEKSSVALGAKILKTLLAEDRKFDAIFCNNDDIAAGILFEAQRQNISVPNQLGLIGYNDLGVTSQTFPSVSSVYTPRFQIGEVAVDIILNHHNNTSLNTEQKAIDLGFELQIRESTQPQR